MKRVYVVEFREMGGVWQTSSVHASKAGANRALAEERARIDRVYDEKKVVYWAVITWAVKP